MKRLLLLAALAAVVLVVLQRAPVPMPGTSRWSPVAERGDGGDEVFRSAFEAHRSGVPVEGHGVVSRLLADDEKGSRHQRFIVTLGSGQTLLIAHNIDLAPRLDGLKVGDEVSFSGEYAWNAQGGVVHWTHLDPAGHHPAGWIRHLGRTYQ